MKFVKCDMDYELRTKRGWNIAVCFQ